MYLASVAHKGENVAMQHSLSPCLEDSKKAPLIDRLHFFTFIKTFKHLHLILPSFPMTMGEGAHIALGSK